MSSSSAQTNPNYANPMLNGVDGDAKLASLPIGFRFKPTDAILINYYLGGKNSGEKLHPNRMKEVFDFYDHHPKELTQKYKGYESNDWYFFTRKYPGDEALGGNVNNVNPGNEATGNANPEKDAIGGNVDTTDRVRVHVLDNADRVQVRVAGNGYWLPIIHGFPIFSSGDSSNLIGWKDTWVYYEVRGDKVYETEYEMKEYKMASAIKSGCNDPEVVKKDEWILCGVFMNKKSGGGSFERPTTHNGCRYK